jgi:hypothetical protein
LALASSSLRATMPRMTCGRAAAAFSWSSSRLARFFCRVRRACRFLADSALRTEVVWRGARDDDDDVSVAAAALVAAAAKRRVQYGLFWLEE